MKKATVTAVAESIKSTKQLSPLHGLAPAKSCKSPLESSCSGLKLDAAQAHLHLDLLGLDETCTNIRLIPYDRRLGNAINGNFAIDLERAQDLNNQGYWICIQVNIASGTKADDVTACTALFCEWDDVPIEEQLVLWQSLGLPEPTFMVMTGNKSIHNYWALTVPIEPERWVPLMDRLIAHAGSDKNCNGLNRMMRLAGGHYIDRNGEAIAISKIVNATGYRYDAAQFEELLPLLPENKPCGRPPRKGSSTPGSLRAIIEALDHIPRRVEGSGTYADYRNILWGLTAACTDAGHAADVAVDLMEDHSPSKQCGWDIRQVARSGGDQIGAGTFWWHAKQHGWRGRHA